MPILVTGTAGFVGVHFAQFLLREGHKALRFDPITSCYDVALKRQRRSMVLQNRGFEEVDGMLEDEHLFDTA